MQQGTLFKYKVIYLICFYQNTVIYIHTVLLIKTDEHSSKTFFISHLYNIKGGWFPHQLGEVACWKYWMI